MNSKSKHTFNTPAPNGFSKAIFPFRAKTETVITALCDDFRINFLIQNQVQEFYDRYPKIAQNAFEGANLTCANMHVILRSRVKIHSKHTFF